MIQYNYTQKIIITNAKEKSAAITEIINLKINSWLSGNALVIENIANFFSLQEYPDEQMLSIMEAFLKKNDFFSSIYYGDANNKMINASGWVPYEEFDLRSRPWYVNALNNGGVAYSDVFLNASKDDVILSISFPIAGSDSNGVISGDVSVKTLIHQISSNKPTENGFAFLMDFEGNLIAHPDFTDFDALSIDYKNPVYSSLHEQLMQNKGEFLETRLNNKTGFISFKKNEDINLYLLSFIPYEDFNHLISPVLLYTLIIVALIIFMTLFFYHLMKKYIISPLEQLKSNIKKLDFQTDFHQRIEYEHSDEFSSLIRTINTMLMQAEETFAKKNRAEAALQITNRLLEKKNKESTENFNMLSQEKELLKAVFDKVPVGIAVWDRYDRLLMTNNEFTTITGYVQSEIDTVENWFNDLFVLEGSKRDLRDIVNEWNKRNGLTNDYMFKSKDGMIKDVELRVKFLSDGRTVTTITDITQRRQTEKRLIDSEKKAVQANVAKSQFLANMSHELRTPLNGIIGFSQILYATELLEEQKEYVEYIRYSGKNLLHIISDILDFSKIEAKKMPIESIHTDVNKVALNAIKMIEPLASAKSIKLNYTIDESVNTPVWSDPLRLYQIINNLLSNAVKFTSEGSISLTIEQIKRNAEKTQLKFSVSDTGIGIPEDKLQEIYHSFTQADNSITREYGGTGLGLTISNLLLKLMGSELYCISSPGKGSTFSFILEFDL